MIERKRIVPPEIDAEWQRQLDGYQADLEAALLNRPFPTEGETLDLTPPDDTGEPSPKPRKKRVTHAD
jgi:hypothetical protein